MSTALSPSPIPVTSPAPGAVAANTASSILSPPQHQRQHPNGEQLLQPPSDPVPPIAVDFALSDTPGMSIT
ncbi:15758_t:CDS:1, partial [Acaulospora colombiana]